MNYVHRIAQGYRDAGISVIPLRLDGSKAPALPAGQPQVYSSRLATDAELLEWFGTVERGIGIKAGAVSGGLEILDFDMAETFWPWVSLIAYPSIADYQRGIGRSDELFNKLAVVETPSGGWHVLYRCRELTGNRKLASWEEISSESEKTRGHRAGTGFECIGKGVRIETRGEGGYVVAEGSPCETHASGLPYVQAFGPRLPKVQTVTPDERRRMWRAAMSFDCTINRQSEALAKARRKIKSELYSHLTRNEDEPWTWFDKFGSWFDILEPHGWTTSDGIRWTRPGKDFGVSASVGSNEAGEEVLTVFSTDPQCGPLAAKSSSSMSFFGKFNALVAVEFAGDRKQAAKHVRQLMGTHHGRKQYA